MPRRDPQSSTATPHRASGRSTATPRRDPGRSAAAPRRRVLAPLVLVLVALVAGVLPAAADDYMLVPMDLQQTNHLKAYGLAYHMLSQGVQVEWLLNYRGGSFLAHLQQAMELEARIRGVLYETIGSSEVDRIKAEIERENMDVVLLEKPPRLAVYTPPNAQPWDDAVTLALTYAEIPFDKVYDREVLSGGLDQYDWLHLHHEDFTGQYGKFFGSYHLESWYQHDVEVNETLARELGFTKVSD